AATIDGDDDGTVDASHIKGQGTGDIFNAILASLISLIGGGDIAADIVGNSDGTYTITFIGDGPYEVGNLTIENADGVEMTISKEMAEELDASPYANIVPHTAEATGTHTYDHSTAATVDGDSDGTVDASHIKGQGTGDIFNAILASLISLIGGGDIEADIVGNADGTYTITFVGDGPITVGNLTIENADGVELIISAEMAEQFAVDSPYVTLVPNTDGYVAKDDDTNIDASNNGGVVDFTQLTFTDGLEALLKRNPDWIESIADDGTIVLSAAGETAMAAGDFQFFSSTVDNGGGGLVTVTNADTLIVSKDIAEDVSIVTGVVLNTADDNIVIAADGDKYIDTGEGKDTVVLENYAITDADIEYLAKLIDDGDAIIDTTTDTIRIVTTDNIVLPSGLTIANAELLELNPTVTRRIEDELD
ncbi:MAG: hypothetical protein AAF228_09025, partial [Pseudomonadota bacterium]